MWRFSVCFANVLVLSQIITNTNSIKVFRSDHHTCEAEAREPWSYRGKNGPEYWGENYPACYGNNQSPIAINSNDAVPNTNLAPLGFINYDKPITAATMINNGHTVQLTPEDRTDRTIMVGGQAFNLLQLHFHWGCKYNRGAEHIIDHVQYVMEMHLVHQNAEGQLAVVGVFFQQQYKPNAELQPIVNELPKLLYKDSRTNLTSNLSLKNLLPRDTAKFYQYDGSLTTPTCAEGVIWTLFPNPLPVGKHQIREFNSLFTVRKEEATPNCKLTDNFRPVQPLNERKVYLSK